MSPDEVVTALKSLGVNITRRTLLNYEKWRLIPEPRRGGGGKGGRWTNYPEDVLEEAYASWTLLHGKYIVNATITELFGDIPAVNPKGIFLARMVHYCAAYEELMQETPVTDREKKAHADQLAFLTQETKYFRETVMAGAQMGPLAFIDAIDAIGEQYGSSIVRGFVEAFCSLWEHEVDTALGKIGIES
ncbi:MAG: hypothetical protein P4N41_23470 [Negativicutes bacterium]|nr:hypothetical protein [Negativicutes bacterium]